MIDKEEVKRRYKELRNMAQVARDFGISYGYAQVIVKGPRNGSRRGREDFYVDFDLCELCGAKAKHLHHKDFNNANDVKENLIAVCNRCHVLVHVMHRIEMDREKVRTMPLKQKIEILEYYYGYTLAGAPGVGSGVLAKYKLKPRQFYYLLVWYDEEYIPSHITSRNIR